MSRNLAEWLAYQEQVNVHSIELGLDRVREVWRRMGAPAPAPHVITVAGTNGKGSTVALLEAMITAAGQRWVRSPRRTCWTTTSACALTAGCVRNGGGPDRRRERVFRGRGDGFAACDLGGSLGWGGRRHRRRRGRRGRQSRRDRRRSEERRGMAPVLHEQRIEANADQHRAKGGRHIRP